MSTEVSCRYTACSKDAFISLVDSVNLSSLDAVVTVNPKSMSLLVTAPKDAACFGKIAEVIGDTMDVKTGNMEDAGEADGFFDVIAEDRTYYLRQIAELQRRNKCLNDTVSQFRKKDSDVHQENVRIKRQIEAIAVMIDAIAR